MSFYDFDHGISILVGVIAILSAGVIYRKAYEWLYTTGAIILLLIAWAFYLFYRGASYGEHNFLNMGIIQIQWLSWIILVISTLAIVACAIIKDPTGS